MVICCSPSSCCRGGPGSSCAGSARHRVPPAARVTKTSETSASKPSAANCSVLVDGPTAKSDILAVTRLVRPACSMSTPLGVPVEPEV